MNLKSSFSILLTCLLGSSAFAQNVKLKLISDQLSHPTAMAVTPKSPSLLFVCEQEGRIRIIENGKLLPGPFLDISKEIIKREGYEERGLLGLTFHPNYASNGKFYVFCSSPSSGVKGRDHISEIREYTVSKGNPKLADATSKKLIISVDEPQSNHNGGDLKFGPDGFLYIALGDGGGQNDQHGQYGNAQDLSNLLGKIIRIDVNKTPYAIPADNPFVNSPGAKPEIYAYGFRNPWRFSFDSKTKALFTGDVGQDKYEEVDIVTKGGNYGWRAIEGLHVHRPSDPQPKDPIAPITEYPHTEGISITGGYVYRGKAVPKLAGKYVFADFMGPVWSLTKSADNKWTRSKMSISKDAGEWHVYSFGEDLKGELYLLTVLLESDKGALYQIVP
ncbi:PQQ-dependent sugar dehydrogenase [Pedobacter sp. GR22-6]|uniref:PQQ-dependent sugar dehydrogenase n=1 Tax=Pedobacter sp. GR22-6 TaxID=3127957 RepID=UPI00307CDEC8